MNSQPDPALQDATRAALLAALVNLGAHDARCESEYIAPAGGWTECGCFDRALALVLVCLDALS